MIVKQGVDNDIQMLYEITDNIPSSYLRFTVFERIHELDPEKQVERVGRELSQELSAEVQKYAELFQKREAQVQHIEDIATREGVFDDAEKLGEAADRIPHTYLQRTFWDRYNAMTHRYGSIRKKDSDSGGDRPAHRVRLVEDRRW